MPAISVIVPVYNIEDYISKCIESILNQTFTDFELILVDDGSTDQSGKICDEYSKTDKRIHVIHQLNKGVSNARNTGAHYSKGAYISFIDGDDLVSDEYLNTLYSLCTDHKAEMSICGIQRVINNHIKQTDCTRSELQVSSGKEALIRNALRLDIRFLGPVIKLIERKIVINHPFPEGRSYSEDTACVYLWMHDCNRIAETNAQLYFYNYREDSLSGSKINENRLGIIKTYNEMLDFFKANDYPQLYSFFLCEYLLELVMSYELCVSAGKCSLADEFQKEVFQCCRKHLNYALEADVKHYEDLLHVFENAGIPECKQVYISMCVKSMGMHADSIKYADYPNMKLRLRKLLLRYRLSIKEYPVAYNIAYPQISNCYWTIHGITQKVRKSIGSHT